MSWIEQLRSADWTQAGSIWLAAYALGCFNTGYYLVRWRTGQDIRALGSGSAGARNVGRLLGWRGFLATVLGDLGKGALAVWAARQLTTDDRLVALALPAVVAGHLWPVQLRFQGGKGMAAALGALLIYDYRLTVPFGLLFGGAYALLRKTVVPGLFALACLPVAIGWLGHGIAGVSGGLMLVVLVLLAHRKNLADEISRLLKPIPPVPKPHSPEA